MYIVASELLKKRKKILIIDVASRSGMATRAEYGSGELCELSSDDEDPSSSLIPRQKHRQGACDRAPEPVNQPFDPPPSYRATAVKEQPSSAAGFSCELTPPQYDGTERTVPRPGPAPEGRKGDRVCVRAPDGPCVRFNPQLVPLQPRLIGNNQLPPPQHPQLPPPPTVLVVQQSVRPRQPREQTRAPENLYRNFIISCIFFILFGTLLPFICFIPALYFVIKAEKEGEEEHTYYRALRHKKMAKYCRWAAAITYVLSAMLNTSATVFLSAHFA